MLTAVVALSFFLAAPANPCTNGSFEQVRADGSPVDWQILNQGEVVSAEQHSGRKSLRLFRVPGDPLPETGLNRDWTPRSGKQGAMLDRVRGCMEFWYKAVSSTGENISFVVIPMGETAFEGDGGRVEFAVPRDVVGDGQWHRGRIAYDYTANLTVKWVHFGVRILGGAGEVYVDDIAYLEQAGPILSVERVRFEENPGKAGLEGTLHASIMNRGDAAAEGVLARIEMPEFLTAAAAESMLDTLEPGTKRDLMWVLSGTRDQPGTIKIASVSGKGTAERTFQITPGFAVRSCGPAAPVAFENRPVPFACALENTSSGIVRGLVISWPGQSADAAMSVADLFPGEIRNLQFDLPPGAAPLVHVQSANAGAADLAAGEVVRMPEAALPEPVGGLQATVNEDVALLENDRLRLAFRRGPDGFAACEILTRTAAGWKTAGWMPRFSKLVYRDRSGVPRRVPVVTEVPVAQTDAGGASLLFTWRYIDADGARWLASMHFALSPSARVVKTQYSISCDTARELLQFDGPLLYASNRTEAVFPGLEWLVGEEISSDDRDIESGHSHQARYVPDPDMITIPAPCVYGDAGALGLLWDAEQVWDGVRNRPSAVFASPDRFEHYSAHVMGLQLPRAPEFVNPNEREAARPYPLSAGQTLTLAARILADGRATDALAGVDEWLAWRGVPEPGAPPRGSYDAELSFSMRAYLESLWNEDTQDWWTTKNGPSPLLSSRERPPLFVADLLLGAQLSSDAAVRDACRARVDVVAPLLAMPPRLDLLRSGGRADLGVADTKYIAGILAGSDEAGLWRFDADHEDTGVFKGFDYHILGPDNAVAVGTCAENARRVLRYARISGDRNAYEAIRPALEYMARERVPHAAQVWEVPFHAPDILAAAQAAQVFIEAYRFSGESLWLDAAVYWARRGLPFIYLWSDPQRPFLHGATIPVYGASLMRYSWFGRPVQWNGLCLAEAMLDLAPYDNSLPWERIARLILHSAMYQQADEGADAALWPDSIGATLGDKSAWVFPPRQIIRVMLKVLGRDEDPSTVILGDGDKRIHITTIGDIAGAAWTGRTISFAVTYPEGESGIVAIANVGKPEAVTLDGAAVPEGDVLAAMDAPAWQYDEAGGYVALRVPAGGRHAVELAGVSYAAVGRIPAGTDEITFDFAAGADGWVVSEDVTGLGNEQGTLVGTVAGPDPGIARTMLRIPANRYTAVTLRMRASAGSGATFFWATRNAPGFAESRAIEFPITADGAFHEYELQLGDQPEWVGQEITAIRLDPVEGASEARFAVDHIRGQ